jgi:hypothetical protein
MTRLAAGLLAAGFLAAVAPAARAADAASPQTDAINRLIAEGWKKAGIKTPSARATDHEFLRRAFIDLIGRIATPEEVLDFEQDRSPNKRAKLVQRLLNAREYQPKVNGQTVKTETGGKKGVLTFDYAAEYAEHWANVWSTWLMTRSAHPVYREQMHVWLTLRFEENVSHKEMVTRLLTATGKTGDDAKNPDANAVNFLAHHLGEAVPAEKQDELGKFDAVPVTSRITRLFLGIQTNCVQCHDHPFHSEWGQADFWGVNAFFRQTVRDKTPTGKMDRRMMADPVKVTVSDIPDANPGGVIFYERRDGKLMAVKPNFLKDLSKALENEADSKPLPKNGEPKSRRQVLAEYVVKHDNFAKAYVNRIWGHLFGRGLCKEPGVDDFGSHNEVVHPELLQALADDFVKYNYDPKQLLFWICTSDAYSLSHVAVKENADPKFDAFFARMPLKAMSPEVLFESLSTATKAEAAADSQERRKRRDDWMGKLVSNFGDDEGNEITFNGTVVQALLMMNGPELNREIGEKKPTNVVARIAAKHAKGGSANASAIIDELFLAALNRHPTGAESSKILNLMNKGTVIAGEKGDGTAKADPPKAGGAAAKPAAPPKKGDAPPKAGGSGSAKGGGNKGGAWAAPVPTGPRAVPPSGPNDLSFYQDVFWALLNTNEFILNH